MRGVAVRWVVASVGIIVALGAGPGAALFAQGGWEGGHRPADAKSITDQEACQRMKTLLPLAEKTWDRGSHGAKITGAHLTLTGFTLNLDKKPEVVISYAEIKSIEDTRTGLEIYSPEKWWLIFPRADESRPFSVALRRLAEAAHVGRICDCSRDELLTRAELDTFAERTAAWRAMSTKPALSDEVIKKRLLAEDAIEHKNLRAAVNYYDAGVALDPTWAQGWYNAALLSAEQQNYFDAAVQMKHYLILLPDAPDAAAAKDRLLLWEAKAEEARGK
jgi:hypothetical protein